MNLYNFKIAYQSEDELKTLEDTKNYDPDQIEYKILSNGQPNFKVVFARAENEEQAYLKVDAYLEKTKYHDIIDKIIV